LTIHLKHFLELISGVTFNEVDRFVICQLDPAVPNPELPNWYHNQCNGAILHITSELCLYFGLVNNQFPMAYPADWPHDLICPLEQPKDQQLISIFSWEDQIYYSDGKHVSNSLFDVVPNSSGSTVQFDVMVLPLQDYYPLITVTVTSAGIEGTLFGLRCCVTGNFAPLDILQTVANQAKLKPGTKDN